MEKVKDFFIDLVLNKGVQILWGLFVILIGYVIIKILLKVVRKIFNKSKMDKITISFLMSVLKCVAYIILILIVAQIFGISITGMVALLGAAGLAVGLALQDSLSNLANGIVIITTKPFHEGDYIQIGEIEGKVKNIRILTTALVTSDNKLVVLPNSKIVTSEIINYNVLGRRCVNFNFNVAYESDINKVREIIHSVIISNGKVLLEPQPFINIKSLDNSSINFVANCWCDAEDYGEVYYYVLNNVFNEFKKQGIVIPYNQLEVRLRNDNVTMPYNEENLPERVEKVREEKHENDLLDHLKFVHIKNKSIKKEKAKTKKKIENNKV